MKTSQETNYQRRAVLDILKHLPANFVLTASVLGAVVLAIEAGQVGAAAFVTGVGVNAFTDLVKRIASGKPVSTDTIQKQVREAIDNSNVVTAIAQQNQHILAHLLKESHLIEAAVNQGDYNILANLTKAVGQIADLKEALRGDFAVLDDYLEAQSTVLKGNCSGVRGFRRRRQQAGRRIGLTGESLEKDGEGGLGILASGG